MTTKFKDYLFGGPAFEVSTDNNPLTYVLTTAKLDATGHRWIAELSSYNFSLRYVKGTTNVVADALSRIDWHDPNPGSHPVESTGMMQPAEVKEALIGATLNPDDRAESVIITAKAAKIQGGNDLDVVPMTTQTEINWEEEQENTPC